MTNIFSEDTKMTAWSGISSKLPTDTASYPRLFESSSPPM